LFYLILFRCFSIEKIKCLYIKLLISPRRRAYRSHIDNFGTVFIYFYSCNCIASNISRNILRRINSTEMHFTRAGAVKYSCYARTNSRRDSNVMGFHDVQTSRRFSFAHNPRALRSTLRDNGRSHTYAKNRSVSAEHSRDVHPSHGNRQVSMAVTYASAAIENATSIDTRSSELIIAILRRVIGVMCCSKGEVVLEDWTALDLLQALNCNFFEMMLERVYARRIGGVFFNGKLNIIFTCVV